MTTHTPTRREDVRDPIGITGWPLEQGRDGERTPMQWTPDPPASGLHNLHPSPGFPSAQTSPPSTSPPRPPIPRLAPKLVPSTLIAIRRKQPHPARRRHRHARHRESRRPKLRANRPEQARNPLIVSLNFTAQPQTVHLNLTAAGITSTSVKTLLADDATLNSINSLNTFTLPPYTTLIAEVQ